MLPQLALVFVGGAGLRRDLHDLLWMFAVLGTVLSMLQLLVYDVLARQRAARGALVWAALRRVLLARSRSSSTLTQLLTVVLVVDAALFVVLLVAQPAPSSATGAAGGAGRRLDPR